MDVNVRGQVISIHESNLILAYSKRLQDEMTTAAAAASHQAAQAYLDVNPTIFHSLLSYFKQLHDSRCYNHRINNHIQAMFQKEFKNNAEVLATMVYLEMADPFVLDFIQYN